MSKFQAPPIRTPFLGNPPNATLSNGATNVPSYAWTAFFQAVTNALSTVAVPATSTSPGQVGQRAVDANFEYICIATNQWKRIPLVAF